MFQRAKTEKHPPERATGFYPVPTVGHVCDGGWLSEIDPFGKHRSRIHPKFAPQRVQAKRALAPGTGRLDVAFKCLTPTPCWATTEVAKDPAT
jgi:hypothetical protein